MEEQIHTDGSSFGLNLENKGSAHFFEIYIFLRQAMYILGIVLNASSQTFDVLRISRNEPLPETRRYFVTSKFLRGISYVFVVNSM